MRIEKVSRRDFLKATGLMGSGLMLGFSLRADGVEPTPISSSVLPFRPNAFIRVTANGVELIIPSPEIGQGIRTSQAMILCDEMDADLDQVTLKQAPPDPKYGHQTTGGSNSIRRHFEGLRKAGATARAMLVTAAAKRWGIDEKACRVEKGVVKATDGRALSFGELAAKAADLAIPNDVPLKKISERQYIGKSTGNVDMRSIVDGSVAFGIDATCPGMLYGAIVRPPVKGQKLLKYDDSAARKLSGVVAVKKIGQKIGVIAENTYAAMKGCELISAEWSQSKNEKRSTEKINRAQEKILDNPPEKSTAQRGDFDEAYGKASMKVDATCMVPIIAHAPLEPPNCLAHVTDEKVEIWAPFQHLERMKKALPEIAGVPKEKIVFHTMRIGGGFGRKLIDDFVREAIALSRAAKAPVKLTFSRQDDLRHSVYRRNNHYKLKAGLLENGQPQAIEFVVAGKAQKKKKGNDFVRLAPNFVVKGKNHGVPVRFGPLRAPNHNADNFAYELFIDVMAERAEMDPLDYRLALYGDPDVVKKFGWSRASQPHPEMANVLRLVKAQSKWKSDDRYGYGVSTFHGYGSRIALVALAPKTKSGKRIERFYAAVDCGLVVNPSGAEAQIEGGVIDAYGAAWHQEIVLEEGRVTQSNYHDHPLLRMSESAPVEVQFVKSNKAPQGLGEVSYPAAAAAISNALFAANGKRISAHPMKRYV